MKSLSFRGLLKVSEYLLDAGGYRERASLHSANAVSIPIAEKFWLKSQTIFHSQNNPDKCLFGGGRLIKVVAPCGSVIYFSALFFIDFYF